MRRASKSPKRKRYVRPFEEKCSFYANGGYVLVVREGTIVTVFARSRV